MTELAHHRVKERQRSYALAARERETRETRGTRENARIADRACHVSNSQTTCSLRAMRKRVTRIVGSRTKPMESKSSLSGASARIKKLASEEFGSVLSRRSLARVAGALPTQAFDRLRTALMRQAGVKIGPSSLVQGSVHITGSGQNPCEQVSIGSFSLISG